MQECGLVFQIVGGGVVPMEAPGEWAQVPGRQKEVTPCGCDTGTGEAAEDWRSGVCLCAYALI